MTLVAPGSGIQDAVDGPRKRLEAIVAARGEEHLYADLCNRLCELIEWKVPRCGKAITLRDVAPCLMERAASLMMLASEIELDVDRLLARAGIMSEFGRGRSLIIPYVSIAGEFRPGDTYPDLLHLTLPLAIYCDGHDSHSSVPQRERDYRVGNALQAIGYTILRFSGQQIQRQPEYVMKVVQQAMRRLKMPRGAA